MKKNSLPITLFIITLFSLIVTPGYQVFVGDHQVYLPLIFRKQDPSLFPNDLLVTFDQLKYTLFDELILFFTQELKVDIFILFFLLAFLTRFIYYYSIYKLAFFFSGNKIFSYLSIIIFLSGFSVYGYPYLTMETILIPRLISLSLNLLFLALFLEKKSLFWLAPLLLGFLIHPISAPPFIIFGLLAQFTKVRRVNYNLLFLGLIVSALIFLLLSIGDRLPGSALLLFTSIDSTWQNIIRERNPYYFLSNWNWQILILLTDVFIFLIVYLERKRLFKTKRQRNYLSLLFFTSLLLLFSYLILGEILNLHFVIQLQLLRNIYLIKIFSIIFFLVFFNSQIKRGKISFGKNFLLVGITTSLIFQQSFIFPLPLKGSLILLFVPFFLYLYWLEKMDFKSNKLIVLLLTLVAFLLSRVLLIRIAVIAPLLLLCLSGAWLTRRKFSFGQNHKRIILGGIIVVLTVRMLFGLSQFKITPFYFDNQPFLEACWFIKNQTQKSDVFITEPFTNMSAPVRLSCQRNIFVDRKSGSFAILFDRDYALEWKKRMDSITSLKENYNQLAQILKEHQVDYIFSDSKLDTDKPQVFGNSEYFIYKIN